MYVHEAAIHACMRASPVGLAWGGGPAAARGILGESIRGFVFQGRGLSTFALRFYSSGLVYYGEWTEEIRAWVLESLGPALFLWQPELGSFFPPPLSLSSLGGRPAFLVPLLPSGGHQEKDGPERRRHSKGDWYTGLWGQKGA